MHDPDEYAALDPETVRKADAIGDSAGETQKIRETITSGAGVALPIGGVAYLLIRE